MPTHLLLPIIALSPLFGALIAGFPLKTKRRVLAHSAAITSVMISWVASLVLTVQFIQGGSQPFQWILYHWALAPQLGLHVGFLIDSLTLVMINVVTFVSLMVHIYTIGYMEKDPGYCRFFSTIAFFTFAMLMLVMSDNLLQLFFGWEGVGVASYLLIGFWFTKESAIFANLKAFLVNRVGDFGFLLGIAILFYYTGSLEYAAVFKAVPILATQKIALGTNLWVNVATLASLGLFIGAMGKSAQMPLHVWLPDSMEGPTPISALIHAATMVTAGVFLLARFSPLFEASPTARTVVLVIGSLTCLLMGLVGIVQNDIKRVIAYSTLSQLGYMVLAAGASLYGAAIFHLMTHAFFKALLFLAAGSVIIGMHHEQDIRKMGGLYRYMPITYICFWIGSLALAGIPPFAGFFSKDLIIEGLHHSKLPGSGFAAFCATSGVLVTAIYSFRLLFLTFHGPERFSKTTKSHIHESPAVVWVPLVLLAIPSVLVGGLLLTPLLAEGGFLSHASVVISQETPQAVEMLLHAPWSLPFYLALTGFVLCWWVYLKNPAVSQWISRSLSLPKRILQAKYGFDSANENVIVPIVQKCSQDLWRYGDEMLIDGVLVNGTARSIGRIAAVIRGIQTGYLYHYILMMVLGLGLFLGWLLWY